MIKTAFIVAIGGVAASAFGQANAVAYNLTAINMTDALRGTANAAVGDVFRIEVSAVHNGMSLGLAKFDIAVEGSTPAAATVVEDATAAFDLVAPVRGRHPHMRQATSDKPNGAVGASVITGHAVDGDSWVMSDAAQGGIDLATFPPTFNPLIGLFPIASGEQFFAFDFVYQGGVVNMSTVVRGAGRIYRSSTDGNGQSVSAPTVGTGVTITPAPASLALLGLGGLAAARRRRA